MGKRNGAQLHLLIRQKHYKAIEKNGTILSDGNYYQGNLAGTNVVFCSFYIAPFDIIDDVLLLIRNIGGIRVFADYYRGRSHPYAA